MLVIPFQGMISQELWKHHTLTPSPANVPLDLSLETCSLVSAASSLDMDTRLTGLRPHKPLSVPQMGQLSSLLRMSIYVAFWVREAGPLLHSCSQLHILHPFAWPSPSAPGGDPDLPFQAFPDCPQAWSIFPFICIMSFVLLSWPLSQLSLTLGCMFDVCLSL